MDKVKELIDDRGGYINCQYVSYKEISKNTGVSTRALNQIMNALCQADLVLIQYNEAVPYYAVKIPNGLIDDGFLKLPKNTGLKGMQLIFWVFINERLKHYNANIGRLDNLGIDSWASQIARDMGGKKKDIQNYIYALTKRNYLQRSEDGKYLIINKDLVNIKTTKQLSEEKKK